MMKKIYCLLMTIIMSVCTYHVQAIGLSNPFINLMDNEDVQFSYISTEMLKSLGESVISGNSFQVRTDQLTSLLILKSNEEKTYKMIDKAVEDVVKTQHYILLSAQRELLSGNYVYGLPSDDPDIYSAIIVLEQKCDCFTTLSYYTGAITLGGIIQ